MSTPPTTVEEYLAQLPEDRRHAISAVRDVILAHLPEGYAEIMQGNSIGYVVPHSLYPAGYHCDPRQPLLLAGLASQKSHMALHLMTVYGDSALEEWFREAYLATGKRLDMGKACIRFKRLDDLPLSVIGEVIARVPVAAYLARYEAVRGAMKQRKRSPG